MSVAVWGVEVAGSGSQGVLGAVNSDSNTGRGIYERNGGSANYILVSAATTISNTAGNYDIQSSGTRIMESILNSGNYSGALTGTGTVGGTVG